MNGIDKITQRITEEIDREIADIRAQARELADAITAEYTARAEKSSADILAHGQAAADERQERLTGMARMEAKKTLLAAKQEMISRAFDLALEKLCSLPEKDYVKLLADLAVRASSTGAEALIFSRKDRARIGKAVVAAANKALGSRGKLTLAMQTRPMAGGLILSDGAVEINCSFETLVRLQKTAAAGEVANILFG